MAHVCSPLAKPRASQQPVERVRLSDRSRSRKKKLRKRNTGLLSFGAEAEAEEEEVVTKGTYA